MILKIILCIFKNIDILNSSVISDYLDWWDRKFPCLFGILNEIFAVDQIRSLETFYSRRVPFNDKRSLLWAHFEGLFKSYGISDLSKFYILMERFSGEFLDVTPEAVKKLNDDFTQAEGGPRNDF